MKRKYSHCYRPFFDDRLNIRSVSITESHSSDKQPEHPYSIYDEYCPERSCAGTAHILPEKFVGLHSSVGKERETQKKRYERGYKKDTQDSQTSKPSQIPERVCSCVLRGTGRGRAVWSFISSDANWSAGRETRKGLNPPPQGWLSPHPDA